MTEPLRVLVLHSQYSSGPASGENRVVEDEIRLLREAGHEVHSFVPPAPEGSGLGLVRAGVDAVWSTSAVATVTRLLAEHAPTVVHVHNLFPVLSPAVLRAASAGAASVVVTLHNYRLLCLPATFLRDGRICEDCLGRLPWRGVVHGCYRGSVGGSGAIATSLAVHRALRTFDRVSLFAAVSDFVKEKHVSAGLPTERIVLKNNFSWPSPSPSPSPSRWGPGDYFLYLGRLSAEKGLRTLVQAWANVPAPCLIAGDGPDRAELEASAPANVEFLGLVSPDMGVDLLRGARALVLPSTWYEGAPRSILEAYAAGVPVIASRTGGLPELVEQDVTGLLTPPSDAVALAAAARRLLDGDTRLRMGDAARRRWESQYTPEIGLRGLERLYADAAMRRPSRLLR
jgi:glycosyltransferase involved in cell wall biosynthesis